MRVSLRSSLWLAAGLVLVACGGSGGPSATGGSKGAAGTTGGAGRGGTTGSAGTTGGSGGTGGTGVVIPTDSLVGLYELDGNGNDSSGNGRHGTVTGTTPTTDRFGNANGALAFTSTTEVVTVTMEAPFDLTVLTITAFIRLTPANTTRVIVAKGASSSFGNYQLAVNADNAALGTRLSWTYDSSAGTVTLGGVMAALPINSYVHVAVTMDTASMRGYVDGVLQISNAGPPSPALNNNSLTIGRGTFDGFKGAIDSVRIYSRVLTQAEIAAISANR